MHECIEEDQRMYRAWPTVGHQHLLQLSQRVLACILSSVLRRRIYDRCKGRRCWMMCMGVVRCGVCVRVCVASAFGRALASGIDCLVGCLYGVRLSVCVCVCQLVSSSLSSSDRHLLSCQSFPRVDPTGLAQPVSSPPSPSTAQWVLPSPVHQKAGLTGLTGETFPHSRAPD